MSRCVVRFQLQNSRGNEVDSKMCYSTVGPCTKREAIQKLAQLYIATVSLGQDAQLVLDGECPVPRGQPHFRIGRHQFDAIALYCRSVVRQFVSLLRPNSTPISASAASH